MHRCVVHTRVVQPLYRCIRWEVCSEIARVMSASDACSVGRSVVTDSARKDALVSTISNISPASHSLTGCHAQLGCCPAGLGLQSQPSLLLSCPWERAGCASDASHPPAHPVETGRQPRRKTKRLLYAHGRHDGLHADLHSSAPLRWAPAKRRRRQRVMQERAQPCGSTARRARTSKCFS